MSDASNRSEASSKRRNQAQERQRKRADLNRHYMEQEAVRALEAGVLKEQEVLLYSAARQMLDEIANWLGTDRAGVLNQAICFAASVVRDGHMSIVVMDKLIDDGEQDNFYQFNRSSFLFKPTPETVRALLRAGRQDAGLIYGNAGVLLLSEALQTARKSPEKLLKKAATDLPF